MGSSPTRPTCSGGVIALLGLAVTVASSAWLHLQQAKLSPVRDPVGVYGITGFRAGYRAATVAFAAAGLALPAGIGQALGGRGLAVGILLIVFAVARGLSRAGDPQVSRVRDGR